jgi:translation initiation factor IF-2
MAEEKMMRLSQVARTLNVGISTIADHLATKGFKIDSKPNAKITEEQFSMLSKEFASSALDKEEALGLTIGKKHNEDLVIQTEKKTKQEKIDEEEEIFIKNLGVKQEPVSFKKEESRPHVDEPETEKKAEVPASREGHRLQGIKVVGKIDLDKPRVKPEEKVEKEEKAEPKEEPAKAKTDVTPQPEEPKEVKPTKIESKEAEPTKEEPTKEEPTKEEFTKQEFKKQEPKKQELVKEEEVVKEEPKPEPEKQVPVEAKQDPEQVEIIEPEVAAQPEVEVPEKEEETSVTEKAVVEEPSKKSRNVMEAKADQLKGLTVIGKIDLPEEKPKKQKPVASSDDQKEKKKKKRPRKRIGKAAGEGPKEDASKAQKSSSVKKKVKAKSKPVKEEVSEQEVQEQIKATLAKLSGKKGGPSGGRSKYRREKRSAMAEAMSERMAAEQDDKKVLKVNEFISANDLASMMGVTVNEVISTCMSLGMFVSINQRLDAESITIISDEFGYDVEFQNEDDSDEGEEIVDNPDLLKERAPIVTIMGHVDHGKTSLLDYIRHSKIAAGEAGGITQHIGAYDVTTDSGKRITFLDTPGHEAFTAMRARGAKVTDVVVIVVSADDNVMPQTKEAINHAQVAGVPIVIAINKIDKANANPEKIKEELANINILVEDWGGKYQSQEISAKTGQGINELLEKVLLESELLELKANYDRHAVGTIIEASLDRGRGYIATVLVQTGTLKIGDVMLAGAHYGKCKAMFDHLGNRMDVAGPSTPILVLGLDGAPQAGDRFAVVESDREAREIANKRSQLQREQSIRTKKHITLDEIGRRLAIGTFKELNVIVKGDVDGSIEALSDSMLKLSTEEVQVNIIHKAVGQISESDVLLASASDAVIIGFQVRPSTMARKLAEQEEIEIRLYSVIYDAINDLKDAMEGMLAPSVEEVITGNIEVREVFRISKVGTVAGCMVTDGYIKRANQIRLVRDGIVVMTGEIAQLKRFKDDVQEVKSGYECGLSIKSFNDIKEGDVIEGFEQREVKRKL